MRKAQKAQVEGFIALLKEAQDEIIKAIKNENRALAMDLLVQCQEGAIHAGTLIDKLEGEGAPTVSLLEAYCELVYRLYEELRQEAGQQEDGADCMAGDAAKEKADCLAGDAAEERADCTAGDAAEERADGMVGRMSALLTEAWENIRTSVEKDIPVRREVVFCPYKASMWDSLESVWKAAEEDPDCDAYVIPIPYYDKLPNGALGEMHYEGLEYPKYVPITYYTKYNFEERRPDMVFIHNPYDEFNYVTSVHPFYYAANLKKYTDKLVYIPYFVLGEIDPDTMTPETEEKMKMFCVQSGIINSDRVFVQSEAMKQVYVKILTKEFGEHTRKNWEEKILGLGSPKFDKALSTTEDDFHIPEEWRPILYCPDGTRRKTILYNTGVTALLEQDEAMIEKMKDVFRIFYESRDEVALLWRPHPLIQATIERMRPELWEAYNNLVKEYREAGWGIYDDSAELNRALELADAYYGDQSSLVRLCQEKGMPVMIQDVDVIGE